MDKEQLQELRNHYDRTDTAEMIEQAQPDDRTISASSPASMRRQSPVAASTSCGESGSVG